jgi:hypothetical protein
MFEMKRYQIRCRNALLLHQFVTLVCTVPIHCRPLKFLIGSRCSLIQHTSHFTLSPMLTRTWLLGLQLLWLHSLIVSSQSVTYCVRASSNTSASSCGLSNTIACPSLDTVVSRISITALQGYSVTIDIGPGAFVICNLDISSLSYLGNISFVSSTGAIFTSSCLNTSDVGIKGSLNRTSQGLSFVGLAFSNFYSRMCLVKFRGSYSFPSIFLLSFQFIFPRQ